MSLSFKSMFIIAFCAQFCIAFPWISSSNFHINAYHSQLPHELQRTWSVYPQLTWLRDTLVESVFGPLNKSQLEDARPTKRPNTRPSASKVPSSLTSKYGKQVVLRFTLSTPEEEQALTDAVDVLLLDVWAFTNSWADVQIQEDMVWRSIYHTHPYTKLTFLIGAISTEFHSRFPQNCPYMSHPQHCHGCVPIYPRHRTYLTTQAYVHHRAARHEQEASFV